MTQCARALWTLAGPTAAVAVVRKPRPTVNICSPDTRPSPKTTVAYVCASAGWLRGVYPGRGQMSSTSSDDGGAYSHAPLNM